MNKSANEELLHISDALVEDILDMSDEEILAEANKENVDVSAEAARLRSLFQQAELRMRKKKLQKAKEQVLNSRDCQDEVGAITDIKAARRVLAQLQQDDESIHKDLMLAARKANKPIDDLSDEDVLSLANDLKDLGLWHDDEQ